MLGRLCACIVLTLVAVQAASANGLVVIDRRAIDGTARVQCKLRQGVVTVAKGAGTDPATIAATLDVAAAAARGQVAAPAGAGWLANDTSRARYKEPAGAVVRTTVRSGRVITLSGGSLGTALLDALAAGPVGTVFASYTVDNAGEVIHHCVRFDAASCSMRTLGGGSGHLLRCGSPAPDAACVGVPPVCGNGVREPGEACDSGPFCTASCQLVSLSPGCCQGTGVCMDRHGFSLHGYLFSACWPAMPVVGGVCSGAGTCDVIPIDSVPECCQLVGSCYDGSASTTHDLWGFRNYCTGGQSGTVFAGSVCGAAGTCEPG